MKTITFSKKDVVSGVVETEEEVLPKRVPCEIYSRVVGYFRPLGQWNPGKKEEFKDRKTTIITEETIKEGAKRDGKRSRAR